MTIQGLCDEVVAAFNEYKYSETTIQQYQNLAFKPLIDEYCKHYGDNAIAKNLLFLRQKNEEDRLNGTICKKTGYMKTRVLDVMISLLETGKSNLDNLPPVYVQNEKEPPIYDVEDTPIFKLAKKALDIAKEELTEKTYNHYASSAYMPLVKQYCHQFGRELRADNLLSLRKQIEDSHKANKISMELYVIKTHAIDLMLTILAPEDIEYRSLGFVYWKAAKGTHIRELAEKAIDAIENEGCSKSVLSTYVNQAFIPIVDDYRKQFGDEPTTENLYVIQNQVRDEYLRKEISKYQRLYRIRGINVMLNILETGEFKWHRFPSVFREETEIADVYKQVFEDFVASCSYLKDPSKEITIARSFFTHLESVCSCPSVKDLNFENCVSFAEAEGLHRKKMSDVVFVLRKLFRFLNETGRCADKTWKLFKKSSPEHKKVLLPMPYDDIIALGQSFNKDTIVDKRDFAITTLISATGLRCVDIAGLCRKDINWRNNEIYILQSKTDNYVSVPLEHKFLEPVADYLLNYRPDIEDDHVFLTVTGPPKPLSAGAIGHVIQRGLKKAGIEHIKGDGKTAHGIRRALGTEMTVQGVELHTVGQVLGQINIESAKSYISINTDGLKLCTMSMSSLRRWKDEEFEADC